MLCELLIMNSYFSNSSLDVWSKYNSFWTWNVSLSRGFWEEWKEWIVWQSSLLRFGALVRSRESFGGFFICLSGCTWNKVIDSLFQINYFYKHCQSYTFPLVTWFIKSEIGALFYSSREHLVFPRKYNHQCLV